MNLEHPILNIFGHLKRRYKAERTYFANSEKTLFQALVKNIFEKKIKFFAATKKSFFLKNRLFPKKHLKIVFSTPSPQK